MNLIGFLTLLFTSAYIVYLCITPFGLIGKLAAAATPLELLKAVIVAKRHYGINALLSLAFASVSVMAKGVALLTGNYSDPKVFARLAFGTDGTDIVSRLGVAGSFLLGAAVVEFIFLVRYDAFVRMIFVLRKFVNLELQVSS